MPKSKPSARDTYIPVVGRKPVIEALHDQSLNIAKVLISRKSQGPEIASIEGMAASRKIDVERVDEAMVTAIAKSSKQHQGVVADVSAPRMLHVTDFCEGRRRGKDWACSVLVLDGLHNPANVGMILRSATAFGIDGIVVPHKGTAPIGPVAIKASAGIAFKAPIIRSQDTVQALDVLAEHRFEILAVDAGGANIAEAELPERAAYIIGNETVGLSQTALQLVDRTVSIPMASGVESLNAAIAGSVLAHEITRRSDRRV